jgi:Ala-tRNA(Pro) deacylase
VDDSSREREKEESGSAERAVLDYLQHLGIAVERHAHPPVFTVEEAGRHWAGIAATHCKNLFLRNAKGTRHYLVILGHTKTADLKGLAARIGDDRLSFASPERLQRFLGLAPGSVSPFGLIHPAARDVIVVLDADLARADRLGFHPNVNTATITLTAADFFRFLASRGNVVRQVAFGPEPPKP